GTENTIAANKKQDKITWTDLCDLEQGLLEWWPGTELNRRRQPFQATLCCILDKLSDFRWPPKYLRSRERHANRGWKSWVQSQILISRRRISSDSRARSDSHRDKKVTGEEIGE